MKKLANKALSADAKGRAAEAQRWEVIWGIASNLLRGYYTVDTKQKKSILKEYLGFLPAWFDLRKKEILNDNINIEQWQINMNYLICNHGAIDSSERKAFEHWPEIFENSINSEFEEYFEKHVTPVLLNISKALIFLVYYTGTKIEIGF